MVALWHQKTQPIPTCSGVFGLWLWEPVRRLCVHSPAFASRPRVEAVHDHFSAIRGVLWQVLSKKLFTTVERGFVGYHSIPITLVRMALHSFSPGMWSLSCLLLPLGATLMMLCLMQNAARCEDFVSVEAILSRLVHAVCSLLRVLHRLIFEDRHAAPLLALRALQ